LQKFRKATISFVLSVRLSVRMEQLGLQWPNFRNIFHLNVLQKSVDEIQISLMYDNNSATNRKVPGSIPGGVSGFFIDIKSFRSHYGPGVDLASNRNEYQEHFLGVKAAGA